MPGDTGTKGPDKANAKSPDESAFSRRNILLAKIRAGINQMIELQQRGVK